MMIHKLVNLSAALAIVLSLSAAPVLTATGTALAAGPSLGVTLTASSANPAHPDDTITYTATITNSGDQNANNVQLSTTPDGNTSLVSGSVHSSPIARPDSYN